MKKIKECGCIVDSSNLAVITFCRGHQEEHDSWIDHVKKEVI